MIMLVHILQPLRSPRSTPEHQNAVPIMITAEISGTVLLIEQWRLLIHHPAKGNQQTTAVCCEMVAAGRASPPV